MRTWTRPGTILVPLALVFLLAFPVHAQPQCTRLESDDLLIGTGGPRPPPFTSPSFSSLTKTAYFVSHIVPGESYDLRAANDVQQLCVANVDCAPIPDFNIAFYRASGAIHTDHDHEGDQQGYVPYGAAYAYVYMAYGPDLDLSDGAGATFVAGFDCAL